MSSTITDRLKRKRGETKDQPIPSYVAGKFKEWVSVNRETGCWEWKLSRQKKRGGYGQKTINYKLYTSHRLAWLVFKGDIPKGMFVCHKCDNPPCCNPDHLFLGTPSDNSQDAWRKGRMTLPKNAPVGSSCTNSALSEDEVYEIRQKFDEGFNRNELAREYGVNRTTIYNVGGRKTWKHLKEVQ